MTSFPPLQHGTCTPDKYIIMSVTSYCHRASHDLTESWTGAKVKTGSHCVRAAAFSAGQLSTLAVVHDVYHSRLHTRAVQGIISAAGPCSSQDLPRIIR